MSLSGLLRKVLGQPVTDATLDTVLATAREIKTASPELYFEQHEGLRGHVYFAALQVKHRLAPQAAMAAVFSTGHAVREEREYHPRRPSLPRARKNLDWQNRRRQKMGRTGLLLIGNAL